MVGIHKYIDTQERMSKPHRPAIRALGTKATQKQTNFETTQTRTKS